MSEYALRLGVPDTCSVRERNDLWHTRFARQSRRFACRNPGFRVRSVCDEHPVGDSPDGCMSPRDSRMPSNEGEIVVEALPEIYHLLVRRHWPSVDLSDAKSLVGYHQNINW